VACSGGRVLARDGTATLTDRRVEVLVARSGARDPGAVVQGIVATWAMYHSLGRAAAANDSLNDSTTLRRALESAVVGARLQRWLELESNGWIAADSGRYRPWYNAGDPLAAMDVTFAPPSADSSRSALARARAKAAAFRATATPATFETAARLSGGNYRNLAVFGPGRLAPELEHAIRATPPGRISAVVNTPFGSHVLYRPTFDEVAAAVVGQDRPATIARGQRAYIAIVDSAGRPRLTTNAVRIVRAVATNPDAHDSDSTVIATTTIRDLTAARLAWWFALFPPSMATRAAGAPDSVVRGLVTNIVGYEVMLRSADSARVTVDSATIATLRRTYVRSIVGAWAVLNIDPRTLAKSAGTLRTRQAARRVDAYLDAVLMPHSAVRFARVPPAVERVLRSRYRASIDSVALTQLVVRVRRTHAIADSVHDATLPPSVVPMPARR
jgi:hypothetical protein